MIRWYGRMVELEQKDLDYIATYMDDDIRESIHNKIAGECTPEEFLREYVKRDSEFEDFLNSEMRIEL